MSEYKLAITAAAKHVYGENTSEISFTQLKVLLQDSMGKNL